MGFIIWDLILLVYFIWSVVRWGAACADWLFACIDLDLCLSVILVGICGLYFIYTCLRFVCLF